MNRLLARAGVHRPEHVSVARDFSVYSSVNIVSLVLLLGTALMLRRALGPYLAGIWTGLELLPTYVAYAHLGTLTAAERELPFLLGARRADEFDRVKHTLFWMAHGVGALLAVGLAAAALALRSRQPAQTIAGLVIYSPIVWAQIVATYYVVLYRARKRFVELSARQGTSNLIKAALLVACGVTFGLYGILAAELTAAVLLLVVLHRGLDEPFARVFDPSVISRLVADGLPMLVGAVSFETLRGADQIVILATLGAAPLGVYSITALVCQGIYYLPNALSTVMYPRFQERYGETQDPLSLRKFVEVQLHVLADVLLAATTVLFVALPPAITRLFPQYVETIAPLRVMLVGTYFLCLAPPAGQFLLTVHKQVRALFIAVPAMALGLVCAYAGARSGLVGVAVGLSIVFVVEFAAVNAYALNHFVGATAIAGRLLGIAGTAALWLAATLVIERVVPAGPAVTAVVGGWPLAIVGLIALPLLLRAARRIRALQSPDLVDKVRAGD